MSPVSIGLSLLLVAMVTAEQKYMAVFPKELRNGMNFDIEMVLTEAVSANTEVYVSIRKNKSLTSDLVWDNSESDRSMLTLYIGTGQTSQTGSMMVPYDVTTGEQYYVHISSTALSIKGTYEKVIVTRPQASIVIVTDLPLYRPGQIVLYRVLVVDMYLKPAMNKPVTVEIKDGNKNTIFKMISEHNEELGDYGESLVDGNFTLSDDPILGIYTITAMTADSYTERTFEVKEFVLPKYQVMLELDQDYVIDDDSPTVQISGKVTAKYSYGKSVNGRAVVKVAFGSGSLGDDAIEWADDYFSGSSLFTVNVKKENMAIIMPWFRDPYMQSSSYIVSAEMTEENSGKTEFANATLPVFKTAFIASVVKPMPMLFQGQRTNYTFQVELKAPTKDRLKDWDEDRANSDDLAHYTLFYKASSDPQYYSMRVTSNPVNVSLPIKTSDTSLYDNAVEVYFEYSNVDGKKLQSPFVKENIAKYYTWSLQTISAELVPSQNENERCFKLSPFKLGDKAYFQLVNSYYPEEIHAYTNVNGHCFTPEQKHKPQTRVVVYKLVDFIGKEASGTELLTAYVDVNLQWTPEQEVELTVTSEQGEAVLKPGETAQIVVKTKGRALASVKAVDKSIGFMAAANDLTKEQLGKLRGAFRPYGKRENKHPNPPMFPMPMFREEKRCSACTDSDQYMDPKKQLGEAGLTVLTDLYVKHQEMFDTNGGGDYGDYRFFEMVYAYMEYDDAMFEEQGEYFYGDDRFYAMAIPNHMEYEDAMFDGQEESNTVAEAEEEEIDVKEEEEDDARTEFPDTWVWDLLLTDTNGVAQIIKDVPDTITSWEVNAFAMNFMHGLSVSDTKEITVFQPFFLSMNLPYSVVRSEKVDLGILVFNYKDTDLTVEVELEKTENYTVEGSKQTITVTPGSSGLTTWPVTFTTIGDIPLKAKAVEVGNPSNIDRVRRPLIVKPEGTEIREDANLKIPGDGQTEQHFNMSHFFQKKGYIPGSLRMYMYVTGDMMGVFISNIVTKIRMPFGCGEQNIKSLTPSVFIARYLKKINRLDKKTEALVGKVCGAGYRKELNYLHRDGSYSAFGDRPNMCVCGQTGNKWGSTWLTAYVLKVFSLMMIDEITYVSPETLKKSFDFIKTNVTYPSCTYQYVVEKGELIHTEMQGGTATRIGLVAFVLISVLDYKEAALKAGMDVSAQEAADHIEGSSAWLKQQKTELLQSKNLYQMAIVAYALARANPSSVDSTSAELLAEFEKLESDGSLMNEDVSTDEECMYKPSSGEQKDCTRDPGVCSEYQQCCKVACESKRMCSQKPYRPTFRSDYIMPGVTSSMIETKGYVLMAYLDLYTKENDGTKKAELQKKINNLKDWLLSQRKGNGFFSSTQDTVVALEALSRYAITFPNTVGGNFKVRAKANGKYVTEEVMVTPDTYTVTTEEKLDVDTPPVDVSVEVSGTSGTAFVNLVALYNIGENISTPSYNITIEMISKDNEKFLRPCFKKNPNFTGKIGTMVVVEMTSQTGYTVQAVEAEDTQNADKAPQKYEKNDDGTVSIYYMNVDDDYANERCVHIAVTREFTVQNQQPANLLVRDYYMPENNVETLYLVKLEESVEYTTTPVTTGASSTHINTIVIAGTVLLSLLKL